MDYVILTWTAPGDDEKAGRASAYDIRYSAAGTLNASTFLSGTPAPALAPQTAGSIETMNVSGLSPHTRYWFALRASDEIPNWSNLSDVVDILTLATYAGVPAVNSISVDPAQAWIQVSFSEPMNRTSVEQSINIQPYVPYDVMWNTDTKITVQIRGTLNETSYLLRIDPSAADSEGTPIARTFTLELRGLPRPASTGFLGVPSVLAIPMALSLAALASLSLFAVVRGWQSRRRVLTLERAMAVLARRMSAMTLASQVQELRSLVLGPRTNTVRGPVRHRRLK